jgi:hypothetical protein
MCLEYFQSTPVWFKTKSLSSGIIVEISVLARLRELIDIPGMEISSTNGHKWNEV